MSLFYSRWSWCILCGGDFNARIGNKLDYIDGIDSIPRRQVLENDINKHCEPFIDFLIWAKLCIINGRVQGKNDFTYITPKSKLVVDYCLTFIDNLQYIKSCDVLRVKEILDSISHTPSCAIPN